MRMLIGEWDEIHVVVGRCMYVWIDSGSRYDATISHHVHFTSLIPISPPVDSFML